jgi:hypothetical protein
MTGHERFGDFYESLIGAWVGRRRSGGLQSEIVRSDWQKSFNGAFLHETWHTAGFGASPEPTAEAFFGISSSGPGDFIAVYRSGKIAFGESAFAGGEWTLTHRWLREPGIAAIRLKFLDADTYEQEVFEVAADGGLIQESRAVMEREGLRP